jgi:hypothetical protein
MSNQNPDAHKGEHIFAASPVAASLPESVTNPVQFPLVMLPGGFAVHAKFMDVIRLLALDHIPLLIRDKAYEAKQIVGADYWQLLKKAEPLDAGRCIVYLTHTGQLSLVDLGKGANNHRRYGLK